MTRSLLFLAPLAIAACAQRPDAIAPVTLPPSAYAGFACADVGPELATSRAELAALSASQNGAATGDAIGVFLIGVPVSSLTGSDKAGLIAVTKGEVLALESRQRDCAA